MMSSGFVVIVAALYLGGLFVLAFVTDRRAARGAAGFVSSPVVYTLSLAVYCTSWTFYGAVGSAARNGLEFLTIYLGPTVVLMGWWFFLRKLVRISNAQRITSIADFISARYGKSGGISALVTIIALVGITPYIALQLKAVAASFDVLVTPEIAAIATAPEGGLLADTAFWVAIAMGAFVILFGTRHIGARERHPGIVAAIALESIVKLFAFIAIGLFAIYGLHDGVRDLFDGAIANDRLQHMFTLPDGFEGRWITTLFLAGAAMVCLPRQFQVMVVENADERHLSTASWLFPLYLMLISLFVVPITISGLSVLPADANPDLFVLTVPLSAGQNTLALLAFIGGLSAATSMVIVSSIALSIMISNHLVMPILLRLPFFNRPQAGNLSATILTVRRLSIASILLLGFVYYRITASGDPLASIGLISFAGVAQFLPALVGAMFWARGNRHGAMAGLIVGFGFWAYTLILPSLAQAGWAFHDLAANGPWGLAFLQPTQLFGVEGFDPLVHGVFWSITANVVAYVFVSALTEQSPLESLQSALFVNAFRPDGARMLDAVQRSATDRDVYRLAQRVLGLERAKRIFDDYSHRAGPGGQTPASMDESLITHVERELAGSVGAASARSLVSRIVKGETISVESVIDILDRTQQAINTSKALQAKSRELEETAQQLQRANDELKRQDRLKDDFLSHVSHELRTPMTSIRSFSEILLSPTPTDEADARRFLEIIQQESERLTRLLDQILDLSRLEQEDGQDRLETVDCAEVIDSAVATMRGAAERQQVALSVKPSDATILVLADRDQLKQVLVNLLSNAIKFNDNAEPRVWVETEGAGDDRVRILVFDNGSGIAEDEREVIFSKYARGWNVTSARASGTGLGLAISRQLVERMGGVLDLVHSSAAGACFAVTLLAAPADQVHKPAMVQPLRRVQGSD
ncbi:MAG: sensor histidine kinase [Pseudomonadota bacterium]